MKKIVTTKSKQQISSAMKEITPQVLLLWLNTGISKYSGRTVNSFAHIFFSNFLLEITYRHFFKNYICSYYLLHIKKSKTNNTFMAHIIYLHTIIISRNFRICLLIEFSTGMLFQYLCIFYYISSFHWSPNDNSNIDQFVNKKNGFDRCF